MAYKSKSPATGQKLIIFLFVAVALLVGLPIFGLFTPPTEAQLSSNSPTAIQVQQDDLVLMEDNTVMPTVSPSNNLAKTPTRKIKVIITAYSSTVDQTDSTPFITASGTRVKDGIVATNILPFGTKIRLPKIFGDKIFTVEDRMAPEKVFQVDIWFSSYLQALNFGAKRSYFEILTD